MKHACLVLLFLFSGASAVATEDDGHRCVLRSRAGSRPRHKLA